MLLFLSAMCLVKLSFIVIQHHSDLRPHSVPVAAADPTVDDPGALVLLLMKCEDGKGQTDSLFGAFSARFGLCSAFAGRRRRNTSSTSSSLSSGQ